VRDPLKIKKRDEVVEQLRSEGYKVIVVNHKPDLITVKDGKIIAIKIIKKIKGNRSTPNNRSDTYWSFAENTSIIDMKHNFPEDGFDGFDYEIVKEDRT